jgi:hypothetical protein
LKGYREDDRGFIEVLSQSLTGRSEVNSEDIHYPGLGGKRTPQNLSVEFYRYTSNVVLCVDEADSFIPVFG